MSEPADKEALLAACEAEGPMLKACIPLEMHIGRVELMCMVSALQLALRHPHFPPHNRRIVEDIARKMIKYGFADFPATQSVLERGWDPAYDDPAPAARITSERFNALLNGPLYHPMPMFIITRLAMALRKVVDATGEAGVNALEAYCRERERQDEEHAEE